MDSLLTSSYSKRAPITPPRRNPILQNEIIVPEIRSSKKPVRELEPSPEKKVGIGKGEFSEQGRRSFSLAYDEPEKTTFTKKMLCPEPYNVITHSMSKRAVFTPTPRNPIIQEEIPFTPPKVRPKMTQSSIFKTEQKRRPKAVILKLGL